MLKEGDVVTLRVIKVDPDNHRIGLSLRRVESMAYADMDWESLEGVLEESDLPAAETPSVESDLPAAEAPSVEDDEPTTLEEPPAESDSETETK